MWLYFHYFTKCGCKYFHDFTKWGSIFMISQSGAVFSWFHKVRQYFHDFTKWGSISWFHKWGRIFIISQSVAVHIFMISQSEAVFSWFHKVRQYFHDFTSGDVFLPSFRVNLLPHSRPLKSGKFSCRLICRSGPDHFCWNISIQGHAIGSPSLTPPPSSFVHERWARH